MEQFPVSKDHRGFIISGIPDAVKVVRISGPLARSLADLSLHKLDLEFALGCLDGISQVPEEPLLLRQGLWRSAIIHYIKCFGNSAARHRLDAGTMFKGNPLALENHDFFRALRNKNVTHDENSYSQSIPGAVLNDGNKGYKVEKVVCFCALAETLGQENFRNLRLLITTALDWVNKKYDKLCESLTKDLEARPYDALSSLDAIQYSKPGPDDVFRRRSPP